VGDSLGKKIRLRAGDQKWANHHRWEKKNKRGPRRTRTTGKAFFVSFVDFVVPDLSVVDVSAIHCLLDDDATMLRVMSAGRYVVGDDRFVERTDLNRQAHFRVVQNDLNVDLGRPPDHWGKCAGAA